jgi:RHS repeat-associated protein
MQYDPNCNLKYVRDPNNVGYNATFDERNREIQRLDTLDAAHGGPVRIAWNRYDSHNNVVKTKDAYDKETSFVFDGLDRRTRMTDRVGGVTTFKYDKNSNLLEITDADAMAASATQPTTLYRYDARNLCTLEAFRDDALETNYSTDESVIVQFDQDDRRSYGYDAARHLIKRTDQALVQTVYVYDMANRLTNRSYPDGLNDSYQYNADGRLVLASSTRYNNSVCRSYDNIGRLTTELLVIGGTSYTLSYGYDAANREICESYPNGQSVRRSYTDRDELSSVSYAGSVVVTTFIHDNGGRETARVLGNGITQAHTWRSDNLPATIVAPGIMDLSYTWDFNKRKTAEINAMFSDQTNNFCLYDEEDRLTIWQRGSEDTQTWNLSNVGDWNSTIINGVEEVRICNAAHRLLSITPPIPAVQMSYDAKGNLAHNKNGHDYSWDFENRMIQAVVHAGEPGIAGTHTYSYDALGRRTSITTNGLTTVFINNVNWQEVAEYQGGALQCNNVFGAYIDDILVMVNSAGIINYYAANDQFSIYVLLDAAGQIVERLQYDPYGNAKIFAFNSELHSISNTWAFSGRRLDSGTNLLYYRNRMYSPDLGNYINMDPLLYISSPGKYMGASRNENNNIAYLNNSRLYAFNNNKPSMYIDPFGTLEERPLQLIPVASGTLVPFNPDIPDSKKTALGGVSSSKMGFTRTFIYDARAHAVCDSCIINHAQIILTNEVYYLEPGGAAPPGFFVGARIVTNDNVGRLIAHEMGHTAIAKAYANLLDRQANSCVGRVLPNPSGMDCDTLALKYVNNYVSSTREYNDWSHRDSEYDNLFSSWDFPPRSIYDDDIVEYFGRMIEIVQHFDDPINPKFREYIRRPPW